MLNVDTFTNAKTFGNCSGAQFDGPMEYVARLGTTLGSGDVAMETLNSSMTRHSFNALSLREGVTYYSSVTATNGAGLTTTAFSDGVKVSDYNVTVVLYKDHCNAVKVSSNTCEHV